MLKPVQLYNATEYAVARRQDASATLEMTRQVKKVGVITRSEAFHYVDQLRASDVRDDLLQIGAGGDKTAAGQGRWVPVHSALQPTIDRLVKQTKEPDGYLLQSTARNKYAKRSAAAGKRFGRLKDHLLCELIAVGPGNDPPVSFPVLAEPLRVAGNHCHHHQCLA